ncbi:DUF2855 family protein [Undibacterium sp.]|uniref:DUF2855 family protein n=1 Tax=Undibacterium sp. TaxID=1914977 RepID=UPI00374D127B
MSTYTLTQLLTDKNALGSSRITQSEQSAALADGEVLLQIQRCAITTNNITYAAFGDSMQYWQFFPTGIEGWGHMPVWGFADVVSSTVQGVEVGERFYGYFPIASHIRMLAERVTERGFYDGSEHRRTLVSAYNQYTRCSADAAYSQPLENYQMLVRPLFITSFMLADFLQDNAFFGASSLVISSASSKTAYGTAFCLQEFPQVQLVALTSARNRSFVDDLGCYHASVTYEELESQPADKPAAYVDFSGDVDLRARVHHHYGDALVYDCFAGSAQNTGVPVDAGLPGPKPALYFAPVQIRKRNADWGPQVVNERFNAAQSSFIRDISDAAHPWMQVVEEQGFAAAQTLIANLHDGKIAAQQGRVIKLV